jgi:hypothetical protein
MLSTDEKNQEHNWWAKYANPPAHESHRHNYMHARVPSWYYHYYYYFTTSVCYAMMKKVIRFFVFAIDEVVDCFLTSADHLATKIDYNFVTLTLKKTFIFQFFIIL